jgi:two-component system phosphate regulon sensor histidine kinase PhoR
MRFWLFSATRVLVLVALLGLLGFALRAPFATVIAGLSVYLCWHLVQLARVTRWLQRAELEDVPDAPGLWGELSAQLRGFIFRDRKRERRFRTMLREYQESTAAMPDAAVVLNDNREILWFNDAAHRLLGLDAARDIGLRIDNLVRHAEFAAHLAAESDEAREPVEIASPINRKTRLEVHVVPFGAGRRLVLFRDNTRLHQLEKVRRKFVANASHELRSPLTVIAGYLEQLSDDPVVLEDWGDPLQEMQRQAGRMAAIIDDLLELSRLESSPKPAAMEAVDVGRLLKDVVSEAESQVESPPAIRLELHSNANLLGAERELHSVLANLVINAVKYTPARGTVTIYWSADAVGARLAVADTGMGIAPEHVQRLTERFYRVDKGRARGAGGTGLGLAIVKHALQRHDATLQIESEPGRGSTFTCCFPPSRVVLAERRPDAAAVAAGD